MGIGESFFGTISATSWYTQRASRAQALEAASPREPSAEEQGLGPEPDAEPCPVEPFGFECPMGIWWNAVRQEQYLPVLLVEDWLPGLHTEISLKREPVAVFQAWMEHEGMVRLLQNARGDTRETRRILAAIFAAVEDIRSWH